MPSLDAQDVGVFDESASFLAGGSRLSFCCSVFFPVHIRASAPNRRRKKETGKSRGRLPWRCCRSTGRS